MLGRKPHLILATAQGWRPRSNSWNKIVGVWLDHIHTNDSLAQSAKNLGIVSEYMTDSNYKGCRESETQLVTDLWF